MADISYTRTTWADGAEGGTAIDATKLNNIEQGIVDAVAAIGPNDTTEDGTLKAQIDENTSDIETLQESVAQRIRFTGETVTDAYVYTYNTGATTMTQLKISYGANDGMFLQFDTDGGMVIYKIVNGVQQFVRQF